MEVDEKDMARSLAFARVVFGAALFLAPRRSTRIWTGAEAEDFPVNLIARGMGGRDVALGVGTLIALEGNGNARGWLEGCALADASDAIGTLSAWRDLPTFRRLFLLAAEVGAALLGAQLAAALDE